MKRLLIFPVFITLLLSSCSGKKYNSKYEADRACEEWKEKGFSYTYEWSPKYVPDQINTASSFSRKCIYESQTRQYIGKENISVKKNVFYKINEVKELENNIKYKYKNFYF
jgi:hypothetical protein